MKTLKINFTMPEDLAETLKTRISKRKRSAFVADAVRDKLKKLEEEELNKSLVEGYRAAAEEDAEVTAEWQAAGMEEWPQ